MSSPDANKLEERIAELEIENAYQREALETLNETITKQWKEIDRLSQMLEQVIDHLRTPGPDGTTGQDEPPPPHY